MNKIYKITGGIAPVNYRSSSIEVETDDKSLGYKTVKAWAKVNFPDWHHISPIKVNHALVLLKPVSDVPVFVSRKH